MHDDRAIEAINAIEAIEATRAIELLESTGAATMTHPGGTLLAHLRRVSDLLDRWGARPALRLAGLCHAYYGTDGFPPALGDVRRRDELASVIGVAAEELVYFYASCDREFSYRWLAEAEGPFRDRFSGSVRRPSASARRDFAELTVANELDIAHSDQEFRGVHGAALLSLFSSWRALLSDAALRAVHTTLAAASPHREEC